MSKSPTLLFCALLLAPGAALDAQGSRQALAIHADKIFLGDGRVLEDGWLLVQEGRIREVGRGVQPPQGAQRIEHEGAISAGMVLCASSAGLVGGSVDTTRALTPEARVIDAYDPQDEFFARMLAGGVTSVMLTPGASNVVGGLCAVVKTNGVDVLEREGHLSLTLSTAALQYNRTPTSYSGALALLEQSMLRPEGVLAQVKAGNTPVLIEAQSRAEVQRALEFTAKYKLSGALHGAALSGELAEWVAPSKLGVVLSPLGPGVDRRQLDAVVKLAEASVTFAFSIDESSSPALLRLGAAECVQVGLEPAAAWAALSSSAAKIAGVEARVGKLERGLDADFVLWSSDPLDLGSSVQAVYINGQRAWSAQAATRGSSSAQGAGQ